MLGVRELRMARMVLSVFAPSGRDGVQRELKLKWIVLMVLWGALLDVVRTDHWPWSILI